MIHPTDSGTIRSRAPLRLRRRRRRRILAASLVALGVLAILRHGDPVPDEIETTTPATAPATAELPTDRLLTLTAPTLRMPLAVDADPAVPAEADSPTVAPTWVEGRIAPDQSVFAALRAHEIPAASIHPVVAAVGEHFDFRRARPGHRFEAELDHEGNILLFRFQTSPETIYEARRTDEGTYQAGLASLELEVRIESLSAIVESSVIAAIVRAGEDEALAQRFADVFRWDIDFGRDTRPGDALRMLYERVYLDGEFLRHGRVLAAEYRGSRAQESAWWFDDDDGTRGYFAADGQPLQRMFLASPVPGARISSRFNPDRMHPILNVRRPHLGVDYAAPTGTPILATADGTVRTAGYRGAYGNFILIRHANGYETAYAHLHRIGRGIRPGARVRQGQTIGTVGTTGLSTGPHLHYELRRNNRHIDPLQHRETRAEPLRGRALADFNRAQARLQAELERVALPDVDPTSLLAEEPEDEDLKDWENWVMPDDL
ncbi:MAG: M23 family metallopeptidase [Deltaproteobacteria bacterium]|nr:MAG: M23 family metallopeptidase [Deltaproteobacteria bacterium]